MTDNTVLDLLENERRYVARELHDSMAQTMLQLGLQTAICQKLRERGKLELLAREMTELEQRVQLVSRQMRELINDLRPPQVEAEAGLEQYLQSALEVHQKRGGPPVDYQAQFSGEPPALSPLQLVTVTRIIQEALLNIRKHAQASQVDLTLGEDAGHVYITIRDNGQGFDPAGEADQGGAGLANLQARAQLIGGTVTIDSSSQGTEVKLSLPRWVHPRF